MPMLNIKDPWLFLDCHAFSMGKVSLLPYLLSTYHKTGNYTPRERSSGGYIGIYLSVCPSVCQSFCPFVQICVQPITYLVGDCLTIFGKWVYQDETMCRAHSWCRYDVELQPITIFWFDIGLLHVAHASNNMRECVEYTHDTNSTLTFKHKVKFVGFHRVFVSDP